MIARNQWSAELEPIQGPAPGVDIDFETASTGGERRCRKSQIRERIPIGRLRHEEFVAGDDLPFPLDRDARSGVSGTNRIRVTQPHVVHASDGYIDRVANPFATGKIIYHLPFPGCVRGGGINVAVVCHVFST